MSNRIRLPMVCAALILAGCSGGTATSATAVVDPAPEYACASPIVSQAVSVAYSVGCESCTVANAGAAGDASGSTAAVMQYTLPAGESAAIRVTAPAGVTFPGGTQPGVVVSFPEGWDGDALLNFYLRTYLDGILQDASDPILGASTRTGGPRTSKDYYFVNALKAYDAVEFVVKSQTGAPGFVANVFQLCTDY